MSKSAGKKERRSLKDRTRSRKMKHEDAEDAESKSKDMKALKNRARENQQEQGVAGLAGAGRGGTMPSKKDKAKRPDRKQKHKKDLRRDASQFDGTDGASSRMASSDPAEIAYKLMMDAEKMLFSHLGKAVSEARAEFARFSKQQQMADKNFGGGATVSLELLRGASAKALGPMFKLFNGYQKRIEKILGTRIASQDAALERDIIRLAHENSELRPLLLPVLKEAAGKQAGYAEVKKNLSQASELIDAGKLEEADKLVRSTKGMTGADLSAALSVAQIKKMREFSKRKKSKSKKKASSGPKAGDVVFKGETLKSLTTLLRSSGGWKKDSGKPQWKSTDGDVLEFREGKDGKGDVVLVKKAKTADFIEDLISMLPPEKSPEEKRHDAIVWAFQQGLSRAWNAIRTPGRWIDWRSSAGGSWPAKMSKIPGDMGDVRPEVAIFDLYSDFNLNQLKKHGIQSVRDLPSKLPVALAVKTEYRPDYDFYDESKVVGSSRWYTGFGYMLANGGYRPVVNRDMTTGMEVTKGLKKMIKSLEQRAKDGRLRMASLSQPLQSRPDYGKEAKAKTFAQAKMVILDALESQGWDIHNRKGKVPRATKGRDNVLHFKSQAIYYHAFGSNKLNDARSSHDNMKKISEMPPKQIAQWADKLMKDHRDYVEKNPL